MKNQDTHGSNDEEWIGFDLDGTLAKYDGWKGMDHIGDPVDTMVIIAKMLHKIGKKIKVLTARVAPRDDGEGGDKAKKYVEEWCKKNLGFVPEITYEKDASMAALFDDRAVAVEQNTGKVLGGWPDFLPKASDEAKKAVLGKTVKKAEEYESERLKRARAFVLAVRKMALKRKLNMFLVTDGASGILNNGNPAVRNAREAQIKWELEHGADPYEDWAKNAETRLSEFVREEKSASARPSKEDLWRMYDIMQADARLSKKIEGLGFGRSGDAYRRAAIKLKIMELARVVRDGKKIRNNIAHRPGYVPSEHDAQRAARQYAEAEGKVDGLIRKSAQSIVFGGGPVPTPQDYRAMQEPAGNAVSWLNPFKIADRGIKYVGRYTHAPLNATTMLRSLLAKYSPIEYEPAPITEDDMTLEEQKALLGMIQKSGWKGITPEGIKRYYASIGRDARYGNPNVSMKERLTDPSSIIETTIGGASIERDEEGTPKFLTDKYDFNVRSRTAQRDNETYARIAGGPDASLYSRLRAKAPGFLHTDEDPDDTKVKTRVDLGNLTRNVMGMK